ncbi:MAG: heme o synthase [Bacteroidetes bacterium]|nr:heme o synthase [Bacteroidota bacterium]
MYASDSHTEIKRVSIGSKIADYAAFAKLRLASLVVFSAAISYFIGVRNLGFETNWITFAALLVGGFLVTGSSNGFNQVIEKDWDKLMNRTMNRPIPAMRMSVVEGLLVAGIMGVSGIIILWVWTNTTAAILGALALLLYVAVYTPMKRITPFATFVGAFPGAIPTMLGWVAATEGFGHIGAPALFLFATQFMWQFPHFWAIAWVMDDDYKKAGFNLLPSGNRDKSSAFQTLVYTLMLLPVSLLPVAFQICNPWSGIVILVAGSVFLWQAWQLYDDCEINSARKLMFGSFFYLPIVQIAYLIG